MTLYFNILTLINLDEFNILKKTDEIDYVDHVPFNINDEQKSNLEKIKYIFKSFINNQSLMKFPDLYLKFLNNFNELLKLEGVINRTTDNNEQILLNLFNLASFKPLSKKEEK